MNFSKASFNSLCVFEYFSSEMPFIAASIACLAALSLSYFTLINFIVTIKIYKFRLLCNRVMKTYLSFNVRKLVKKINSKTEFYEISLNKNNLDIDKKYKSKKGRPFSLKLPPNIKITPEVVGLIVGEGYIGCRHFVFANSNEKAISEVLDFLKQFNLPIKMYLEISIKNKEKKFEIECKKFWENYLKRELKRIRLRKEFSSITKYGTIHLILNNSLVAKLLMEIILLSKAKIENNKLFSISYLKGIIAAEGNVNVKKSTNCVYMVRISASKPEEREHYKRCLKKAGINVSCKDMPTISKEEGIKKGWKTNKGRAGAVIISGWDNFIKIFMLDLLILHQEKQEKFLRYFVNNKFTKQFIDFNYFIGKRFTMKEAQDYFNFKGRCLDRVLTFLKKGYLSRRKINGAKYAYKLTDKYTELYKKFMNLYSTSF